MSSYAGGMSLSYASSGGGRYSGADGSADDDEDGPPRAGRGCGGGGGGGGANCVPFRISAFSESRLPGAFSSLSGLPGASLSGLLPRLGAYS